jgi:hypothetical protein
MRDLRAIRSGGSSSHISIPTIVSKTRRSGIAHRHWFQSPDRPLGVAATNGGLG